MVVLHHVLHCSPTSCFPSMNVRYLNRFFLNPVAACLRDHFPRHDQLCCIRSHDIFAPKPTTSAYYQIPIMHVLVELSRGHRISCWRDIFTPENFGVLSSYLCLCILTCLWLMLKIFCPELHLMVVMVLKLAVSWLFQYSFLLISGMKGGGEDGQY